MSLSALTDAQIQELLACPKRVQNPGSKSRVDGKHIRRDFQVTSVDDRHQFVLFTRQSLIISDSFSAGLRWKSKSGEDVILMRCNGSDHPHGNSIEQFDFTAQPHVHQATERYIVAGKRAETFAEPTKQYATLTGALHELVRLTNISGLQTQPDEPDLFD